MDGFRGLELLGFLGTTLEQATVLYSNLTCVLSENGEGFNASDRRPERSRIFDEQKDRSNGTSPSALLLDEHAVNDAKPVHSTRAARK